MTIPSHQPPVPVDYISMDGQKKTLAAPPGVRVEDNVKAVLIDLASDCACVVCLELFEKSLQTRCCKTILCAQCYEGINVVKKCPQCNTRWQRGISQALQVGDRHINKQVEAVLKHFQDTVPTEQDIQKAKCQVNALNLLRDKSRKTGNLQTRNHTPNNLSSSSRRREIYKLSRKHQSELHIYNLWHVASLIKAMPNLDRAINHIRAELHTLSGDAPTPPHVESPGR